MSHPLQNTKTVVVGGSAGMGLAIAQKLSIVGADVVIASRSLPKLQKAADAMGPRVDCQVVDTASEASVCALFREVGPIDYLVVPGSSVRSGTFRDMPLADALFTMQSKFWGPYLCAREASIRPGGSITLFSGILSRRPGKNDAVLGPVNAAVEALGRALARDLAPVRVNTISPGMTRGTDAYLDMPDSVREEMYRAIAGRLPVQRVGEPEDIADAALMLMANPFVTGVVLDIDGGGVLV